MVYSDIIKNNWHTILPVKDKYTFRDVEKVLNNELFLNNNDIKGYSSLYKKNAARFVVLCTAIFNDKEYSKKLSIPISTLPIF